MCYTGVLSHLPGGPCGTHRHSVSSVQWTMCYPGVLSIGRCVTQVFCHLCPVDYVLHRCSVHWTMCYTGVLFHLSSAACGTQVFCPVDHVIHIHSVTSVQWTMWYIGVLSHLSICVVTSVQWTMWYIGVLSSVHLRCHICPVEHVLLGCSVTASV